MDRRNFIRAVPLAGVATAIPGSGKLFAEAPLDTAKSESDREYWLKLMLKISSPLLEALSKGELRKVMPEEKAPGYNKKTAVVQNLEGFGRTIAGIAPWLELGADNTAEGKQRAKVIYWTQKSITNLVDPASPDYAFAHGDDGQHLVDAAFLAHGLIRAPKTLWEPLSSTTKQQVFAMFRKLRYVKPGHSNWLLFMAMLEIALLKFGEPDWDRVRIDFAVMKHFEWYKGDGMYGDGANFHFDYYNAFVIQPMLVDILKELMDARRGSRADYELALTRMKRYGVILERMISPEGTFPVVGRSMTYRTAVFQPLAQLALAGQLPEEISPAQVRSALTAVTKKIFSAPGTFDSKGWLQLGFYGHQPEIADVYTCTGSLYLTLVGFLALGLPADAPYWAAPAAEWTNQKAWSGKK
ncbi:DUF2264 domain-containing protein [Chitinophaga horti]|uniref:DUF2264 domain-containing protein n=1 Tax=Chitinophaga horti TaxID=2920382 RepID=A0ABY6IWP1_9BACT|nr:DUF2264 domain-containing protein [Chitinophaga horti]UYQ91804.1 DUF2264 domain-containing protein [Chitinophaga horti]